MMGKCAELQTCVLLSFRDHRWKDTNLGLNNCFWFKAF